MKKSNPLMPDLTLGFRESTTASLVSDEDDEDLPLRAELFSAARAQFVVRRQGSAVRAHLRGAEQLGT